MNIRQLVCPAVQRLGMSATSVWFSAAVLALLGGSALAEPAQMPLSSRTATPPPPNVMVTIDNSLSTQWDFMPEGAFNVKGASVGLGYYDTNKSPSQVLPVGFPGSPFMDLNETCVVQAVKNAAVTSDDLFQMQFRSPDVNSIYYNPDIRYRPWIDPATSPSEMSSAVASSAKWDPVASSTSRYELTTLKAASARTWCRKTVPSPPVFLTTVSASKDFSPGLVYRLTGANPNDVASYTRYDVNGATDYAPLTKHKNRTDCPAVRCTQAQELQNFANWFTFYRTRYLVLKGGVSRSLVDFTDKIRVGWTRFNSGNSVSPIVQNIRPLSSSFLKDTILPNIYALGQAGTTPTPEVMNVVGAYFKKTDSENPWLTTPGTAGSGFLSCRRSVNLTLTDGYYNRLASVANLDNVLGPDYSGPTQNPNNYTAPAPTRYTPQMPFKDGYSNTLADVVMQYYVNDLQPSIQNKIVPIDGDIAYWQHLTQFMVGLGVSGTLDASTPAAKLATLKAIKAGSTSWPDPTSGSPQKIDDMWHASVNTGGDFYSVRDVAELSDALADALGRGAGGEAKEAGIAVSSSSVLSGNLKLVPKYKSGSWNGDLEAFVLDSNGVVSSTGWRASEQVPAAADRNLFTWNGSSPVAFTWGGMGAANQGYVGSADLTDYIRGDDANEGVGYPFRSRGGKVLGDFINSPPVYVKGLVDLGYDNIDGGYRSYVNSKKGRTNGVVFLGGNAGVMHAFHGATGVEVFGYLPRTGLPNLSTIAKKDYGTPTNYHRYFLDGPLIETDALITTRRSPSVPAWSNLLVGSMGAGGKGFFALHVPTANPTALDSNTLLWESPTDDSDVGYVMGEIAVGKIQGGGWKAFVGNGADSASGVASLLIVNLATGVIETRLTVDSTGGNGLMGVSLLKNNLQEVVGAYAGDLKGNLWRFDFNGSTATIGFKGKPLFRSSIGVNKQPITVAPGVTPAQSGVGRIVLFGTGSLVHEADASDLRVQTFYGVLDPVADGQSSYNVDSPFESLSDPRSVLSVRQVANGGAAKVINQKNYYEITGTAVNWTTQKGWYLDLPYSGQRVIYPALVILSDFILIQSMVPAPAAQPCETSSGKGYNYLLTARDGLQLTSPLFDTNNDNVINDADVALAGWEASADGSDKIVGGGTTSGGGGGSCTGAGCEPPSECVNGFRMIWDGDTVSGRWLRLPCNRTTKIKDRVWRRIVNPPTAP